MSCDSTYSSSYSIEPIWQPLAGWISRSLATPARMHARRRQRQALLDLDDHLLADIGVSREQALREAHKRFWN
jgi:uncharacterized protein YjiS (DUF1127 family)